MRSHASQQARQAFAVEVGNLKQQDLSSGTVPAHVGAAQK